jgi:hypothetical protein
MSVQKSPPTTSPEVLLERAHACLENAETQQELAEKQHFFAEQLTISANQLNELGHELEASAIEMKGRERMAGPRNDPPARQPLPETSDLPS